MIAWGASLLMYDANRDAVHAWWHDLADAMRGQRLAGVPSRRASWSRAALQMACGRL